MNLNYCPADTEPIVRVQALNHYFGSGENRKQILFNINIELMPGEIVIMTGPSGSGKTTLLTLIGALRSVQEGTVRVMGQDLERISEDGVVEIRRKIGFIFQAHNLLNSLTAFQNVNMSLELHDHTAKERAQLATDMLKKVGLGERIHYKPKALSGGQRQRVAVARALVNSPRLILADEPTAALDKQSGRDVVDLFQKLTKESPSTILMITHDSRILDVADRIITMLDGRIASNIAVKQSVEICDFLIKCPVFANNTPGMLTEISQKMEKEAYEAATVIFREGDVGDKFYIIRKGGVRVVAGTGEQARTVTTLGPGDFFGEIALLQETKRNATIIASEDVEFYTLDKRDFLNAVARSETFHKQLLDVFFQRK